MAPLEYAVQNDSNISFSHAAAQPASPADSRVGGNPHTGVTGVDVSSIDGTIQNDPYVFLLYWEPTGNGCYDNSGNAALCYYENPTIDPDSVGNAVGQPASDSKYQAILSDLITEMCDNGNGPQAPFIQGLQQYDNLVSTPGCPEYEGMVVDTGTPFPGGRGTSPNPLTSDDIDSEVIHMINSDNGFLPSYGGGLDVDLVMMLPYDVYVCGYGSDGCFQQNNPGGMCADHSDVTVQYPHQTAYNWESIIMPDLGSYESLCNYYAALQPNLATTSYFPDGPTGDLFSSEETPVLGHELIEGLTDPDGGGYRVWTYPSTYYGDEIGDLCSGTTTQLPSTMYFDGEDVNLNEGPQAGDGNPYVLQEYYSESGQACYLPALPAAENSKLDYLNWLSTDVGIPQNLFLEGTISDPSQAQDTQMYVEFPDSSSLSSTTCDSSQDLGGSCYSDPAGTPVVGCYDLCSTPLSTTYPVDWAYSGQPLNGNSFTMSTTATFSQSGDQTLLATVISDDGLLNYHPSDWASDSSPNCGGGTPSSSQDQFGQWTCVFTDDVQPDPTVSITSVSPSSGDVSSTAFTFTVSASGGQGAPYTYSVSGIPVTGCSQTSTTITCTPTATGSYTGVTVSATDSVGGSGSSGSVTLNVYSLPTTSAPTFTSLPSQSTSSGDVGQTVDISASVSDANPWPSSSSYTWYWTISVVGSGSYSGLGCGGPTLTTTSTSPGSLSCTAASAGSYKVSVYVEDPAGCYSGTNVCTGYQAVSSAAFHVYSDPTISAPTGSPGSGGVDAYQPVTFSSALTTGTTGYPASGSATFTWSWEESSTSLGCFSGSATTGTTTSTSSSGSITCTPTAAGTYTISAYTTDPNDCSSGNGPDCVDAYLSSSNFVVDTDTVLSPLSDSPANVFVGSAIVITGTPATGGSGGYTYSWSGLPSGTGCSSTTYVISSCVPSSTAAGTYTAALTATDSNGFSTSQAITFTAYSLNAYYLEEASTIVQQDNGSSIGFYSWYFETTLTISSGLESNVGPYGSLYAFDGLSSTGDAYQVAAAYNWPGCNAGFEMYYSWSNDAGTNVGTGCDPSVSLAMGDTIALELEVARSGAHAGDVCFYLYDYTSSGSALDCVSQPDGGALPTNTYFADTPNTLSDAGYITGPETEMIVNGACYPFTPMPTVPYLWASGSRVTEYSTWSQEYQAGVGSCYSYASPVLPVSSDHFTHYTETNYFHWDSTQDISNVNNNFWWEFESDNAPAVGTYPVGYVTPNSYSGYDVSQAGTFTATINNGVTPYYYEWYVNNVYQNTQNGNPLSFTFTSPGTYTVQLFIRDGSLNTYGPLEPVTVTVFADPSVSQPTAAPSSIDVGQSVTFTSTLVNPGSGTDTHSWGGLPPGCSSTNALTLSCIPTATGTFSITISVTDSNGYTTTSSALSFTVNVDPTVSTPTPNHGSRDLGQSVVFSTTASAGSGSYTTYTWTESSTYLGCTLANSASISCTPTQTGTSFTVSVTVTDSNGYTSSSATSAAYSVNSDPTASTPTPSQSAADVGQTITFSTSGSGGSGGFTSTWSESSSYLGCSTTSNPLVISCTPTHTGTTYTVSVYLTDSNGVSTSTKTSTSFTVDSALAISAPTASPTSVDQGQSVTFTGTAASGGVTSYTYSWAGLPTGCNSANSLTVSCTPSATGTFTVSISVKDGNSNNVTSSTLSFTAYADLSVTTPTASPGSVYVGSATTLATTASGGSGGLSYIWYGLPTGCSSSNHASISCTPSASGTFSITVKVTDSDSGSVTSSALSFMAYSTSATYLYEGASLAELDHGYYAGVSYWWFNTTLTTSSYAFTSEFSGLTNKGDWFETEVGYNWPGCNAGFEMQYASWNSGGTNEEYGCDSGVTLSSGDNVALILYVSTSGGTFGDVCMEVQDYTHSGSATQCESQPDGGSHPTQNYFETTSSALNSEAYFTGPLTTFISNAACATFSSLPDLSYAWTAGTHIAEYFAWSQEDDASSCASYTSPLLSASSAGTHLEYTQAASADGTHWESAQNTSASSQSNWWVFSTDNAPSNAATTTLSAQYTSLHHGTADKITPTTSGGTGSMTYLWYVNGVYQTSTTTYWTWTPGSAGTYTVECYTEDGSGNLYGPSTVLTITAS